MNFFRLLLLFVVEWLQPVMFCYLELVLKDIIVYVALSDWQGLQKLTFKRMGLFVEILP